MLRPTPILMRFPMTLRRTLQALALGALFFATASADARTNASTELLTGEAGVVFSSTRLVFHEKVERLTLYVTNKNETARLVAADLRKMAPDARTYTERTEEFVASPGVSILPAKGKLPIRVVRIAEKLDEHQESLYLLRVRMVPEKNLQGAAPEGAKVKTVLTTLLKVIYRPESIDDPEALELAPSQIRVHVEKNALVLENPTPYWLTVARLEVKGKSLIDPAERLPLLAPAGGRVRLPAPERLASEDRVTLALLTDRGVVGDAVDIPLTFTEVQP